MSRHINTTNPINALVAIYNFGHYKSGDKGIAQTLLSNLHRMPDATIEGIAALCSVSVSTFQRFYRDIGYSSFSEFKLKIVQALDIHVAKNTYVDTCNIVAGQDAIDTLLSQAHTSIRHLEDTLDKTLLETLAKDLDRYQRIIIHDTFFSNEKLLFQGDLALSGKAVTFSLLTEDQQADLATLDQDTFLLAFIGNNARYREIEAEVPKARQQGARIGVLSLSPTFQHAGSCDHYLYFGGIGTSLDMMTEGLIFNMLSIVYRRHFLLP